MTAIVLGDHHIVERQASTVAGEHVDATRDWFVGNDHTAWCHAFCCMGGLRARCCTKVEQELVLLWIEHQNRKHTGCFLSGYASSIVKQCKQFSRPITWSLTTSKWKLVCFVANRPYDLPCTHIEELLSRPFHIVVVHGQAKRFGKWLRCNANPFVSVDTKRLGKTG